MSFAVEGLNDDLFGHSQKGKREEIMQEEIGILTESLRNLYKELPFTDDIKASDDFWFLCLKVSEKLIDDGGALALRKSDFYKLVKYIPKEEIDKEVIEKLDAILAVAEKAETKIGSSIE